MVSLNTNTGPLNSTWKMCGVKNSVLTNVHCVGHCMQKLIFWWTLRIVSFAWLTAKSFHNSMECTKWHALSWNMIMGFFSGWTHLIGICRAILWKSPFVFCGIAQWPVMVICTVHEVHRLLGMSCLLCPFIQCPLGSIMSEIKLIYNLCLLKQTIWWPMCLNLEWCWAISASVIRSNDQLPLRIIVFHYPISTPPPRLLLFADWLFG